MFRLKSINILTDCRIDSKSEAKRKKMREKLKFMRNLMTSCRIVNIDYVDHSNAIRIIFNNGIISYVYFNCYNHQSIVNIRHDKYLLNKLLSEHVVNVEVRDLFILVSYTQPKLSYVSLSASTDNKRIDGNKSKISSRNPHLITIELENSTTRRAERKLVVNDSGDLLIVWWKTGTNTVAPWSAPGRRLREMANIFIYRFSKHVFELISFGCITGDIFEITFMKWNPSQLVLLQQSTDSSYVLNYCILEINESFECLQQIYSIRIPLLRPCLRAQFTSAQDKIVLLCDDDSIMLFNIEQNALYSLHSSVKAFDFACNQMDAVFTVADQFGRVSLYDYAFNTLSTNYDELFNDELCHLRQIKFITPTMLCILFTEEKSKLVIITLPDAIDNKTLITEYVKSEKISEAIAALQTINWNCYCDIAYFCVNTIFNHLINEPLSNEKEVQLEKTLAAFFTPSIPIDDELFDMFKLEMHYLAKRFFYHLLRYNCLEKAFLLGVDLKSKHLFMLLYKIAKERGNTAVAEASLLKSQMFRKVESEHSYYIDHSIIAPNGYSSREQNNNNNNNNNNDVIATMKESIPVSSSLNTVGLPSTNCTQSDYKEYHQNHYETKPNASNPLHNNMPIASILKPSSSKSLASIVTTKPVTFSSPENHAKPNETLYTLSTKRNESSLSNGYLPLVSKNKFSHKTKVCIENENSSTIHSLTPKGFNRSSISSSSSSSSSNPSKTSSCSSSSYTSASLSLHTPPIILETDKLSHELNALQLNTIKFNEPPPDLPPRTYLMKQFNKPPERPPKKLIIVDNNTLNTTHLSEHLIMNKNTTTVPFNLPELKSSSKIECIHFGVV